MTHDGGSHEEESHKSAPPPVIEKMDAMTAAIPPFETFYADHAGVVLAHLRRKLGPQRAEDAFQETFLRALRAYGRLEHGRHLRSWVLTIASNVAVDTLRRTGREHLAAEPPELVHTDDEPAFQEIADLTDGLPHKERAAVVLRYGYDLTYEEIAAALDSSPDAARQAASAGVRRLRDPSGRSTA
jgi:RNA polymerase sigma factor (sigma-70 family)